MECLAFRAVSLKAESVSMSKSRNVCSWCKVSNHFYSRIYDEDSEMSKNSKRLRENFVGWQGLGGSVFQWHPEMEIGFGFTRNLMHWYDFQNLTAARLQKEVVKCIKDMEH